MSVKHPRLSRSDIREFIDSVVALGATNESVEAFFLHRNFPPASSQENQIADLVSKMITECGENRDRAIESVEAKYSAEVFQLIELWPDEAIGDEGCWNYLSTRFFWQFVQYRQTGAWKRAMGEVSEPDEQDSEKRKLEVYFIGKDHYQIPLRMYLRGQAIRTGDDFDLALTPGTDFWRSQILGVRTSVYPPLARSVVALQRERSLSIEDQRPPGRRINRLRANIEFALHSEAEAEILVNPIWAVVDKPGSQLIKTPKSEGRPADKGVARAKGSRAREFDLMFGCLEHPRDLLKQLKSEQKGAALSLEGISFEYGNIEALVPHLDSESGQWPFQSKPSHICHLDSIPAARKREIEQAYGMEPESLTGRTSRADLFIQLDNDESVFVSVKDDSTNAKLGQVSTPTEYGSASLSGGITSLKLESDLIPKSFDHTHTGLNRQQFSKLGAKDQRLAYYKRNFPNEWSELVNATLSDAVEQTRLMAETIANDKASLISFVSEVLAGSLATTDNYFLLIGNRLIRFSDVMEAIRTKHFDVSTEIHAPKGKKSYIIWVDFNGTRYGLTKIEPAFDGTKVSVEQTKGVIFYFQEHPRKGKSYKDLLVDLVK